MSPFQLKLLLHYHAIVEDIDNFELPLTQECIARFCDIGLMEPDDSPYKCSYRLTEKGTFYVKHICSIPLPVTVFKIPEVSKSE